MTTTSRIRKIAVLLGLVSTCFLQVSPAFAQADPAAGGAKSFQGALQTGLDNAAPAELHGDKDLSKMVGRIISAALGLLGVLLLGYFLYAGFLWMTAGGDAKKVTLATDHIRNAIIGLIIIVIAYSASSFVIQKLSTVLTGVGS